MATIMRRVMGILISLALGCGLMAGVLVAKARAAPRCDAEPWICKALRQQHRTEREREEAREERARERAREYARERQAELDRERRHRYERYGYRAPATRVYGVTMRDGRFVEDDAPARGHCYATVEGRSFEHTTMEAAYADAQRAWANNVRWAYGEKYMDIRNANPLRRQCSISTVKQSVAGRVAQGVKEAIGVGDEIGNQWRCEVRAGPCQAPIELDPAIKGEKPQ